MQKQAIERRAHRRYRGVAIYRDIILDPGSTFKVTEDGRIAPRTPRQEDKRVVYYYAEGYPESSIKYVKDSIDDFWRECIRRGIDDDALIAATLNHFRK